MFARFLKNRENVSCNHKKLRIIKLLLKAFNQKLIDKFNPKNIKTLLHI